MSEIVTFAEVVVIASFAVTLALASGGLSGRTHVPAPVVFLVAAAVASDLFPGLGDALSIRHVERIGVVALIAILFDGGMQVGWRRLHPAIGPSAALAVAGTFATAALVAVVAKAVLPVGWTTAAIVGAALAPTDPAVVLYVLGRREIPGRVATILQGEAGGNDPVGIALMISVLAYATGSSSIPGGILEFILAMAVGLAGGALGAAVLVVLMRRAPLVHAGLYPVRTLALAGLVYGVTTLLHGSGFLAVFVAGVMIGDARLPFKGEVERFHAALASLAEIVVFVGLGLTVHLAAIDLTTAARALLITAAVVLLIRPAVAGLLLLPANLRRGEKAFIAWSGFKGAVPILLASLAVLENAADARLVYQVVFIVVAVSVVVHGLSLRPFARLAGVPIRHVEPLPWAVSVRLRDEPENVRRVIVAAGSRAADRRIRDLPIGEDTWISLIVRDSRPIQPRGSVRLQAGDELLILAGARDPARLAAVFERDRSRTTDTGSRSEPRGR
jgi:cell volume regulation protein A